jgi:hypothetical protein
MWAVCWVVSSMEHATGLGHRKAAELASNPTRPAMGAASDLLGAS